MVPGIPLWPPRGLPRPALASFACRTIDHEGAFLGIDFGGRGPPISSLPHGRAQDHLVARKKYLELFAVRKILNYRVPHATCLCMTLRDSLSRISTFWSRGRGSKSDLRVSDSLRRF